GDERDLRELCALGVHGLPPVRSRIALGSLSAGSRPEKSRALSPLSALASAGRLTAGVAGFLHTVARTGDRLSPNSASGDAVEIADSVPHVPVRKIGRIGPLASSTLKRLTV